MKKILFICKYNRFRSIFAEAFFNKYNKNKSLKAKSAAPILGTLLSRGTKRLAKEFNVKIKKRPTGLTSKLLKWQNVIVIVADDVPKELFKENKLYGKELIHWQIHDTESENLADSREIIKNIKQKVIGLIKELNK